jgi:hypothetical protein
MIETNIFNTVLFFIHKNDRGIMAPKKASQTDIHIESYTCLKYENTNWQLYFAAL